MSRRFVSFAAATSLFLCGVVVVLWEQSYAAPVSVERARHSRVGLRWSNHRYLLVSSRGGVGVLFSARDVTLASTLTFANASSRDVYSAIAKLSNISLQFDPQFRDQPITVELRNSSLINALDTVSNATRNFYRVTGQRTVTIIPDTPS